MQPTPAARDNATMLIEGEDRKLAVSRAMDRLRERIGELGRPYTPPLAPTRHGLQSWRYRSTSRNFS